MEAVAMAATLTEEHEDEDAQLQRGNLWLMGEVSELAALLRFPCRSFWLPLWLHESLFWSRTCSPSVVCEHKNKREGIIRN